MKLSTGEIITAPKMIYWIEAPPLLGEDEKVEFLKQDILVVAKGGHYDNLHSIKKLLEENTLFIFNLDKILGRNSISADDAGGFVVKLVSFITSFAPQQSLIHTNIINSDFAALCQKEGIPYIEKNLEDKSMAFSTILSMIRPFFSKNNKITRSFVRLNLLPMKYKIEITNLSKRGLKFEGILKDLSFNGLAVVLTKQNDLNFFALKDQLSIKISLPRCLIRIQIGLVTRLSEDNMYLGVNFNLHDTRMINQTDADKLTKIMYKWLHSSLVEADKKP